ncbi:MAG: DegT/DnrJ/EryC1/StrS family aminotransferase [Oscillospiraceae bacterium]|nr:DegT/DnrJ/EryC1/StrS family aminotransferase [Oscillospiraceae bacterium]
MIPIAKPLLDSREHEAVLKVLESGAIASGEDVLTFEREFSEYAGTRFAVAICNGTAALHAAIKSCDINPGDKVITTPFTFAATANSILFEKAVPIFVDIDPSTFNIDPIKIEEALKKHGDIKAIIIVHLFGLVCDMSRILDIAKAHGIALIEDAAQAHGAMYGDKMAGSFGRASTFSFYPTKNMTTSEGGMILTDDEGIYRSCKTFINHGQAERYIHETLGYNFRMTNIAAAIGLVQLKKLDAFNEKRILNASYYNTHIDNTTVAKPLCPAGYKHVYHQYTLKVKNRDRFVKHLADNHIGTGIHYPLPLNGQPLYKRLGYSSAETPIAQQVAEEVVSIPVHPALSQENLEHIAKVINQYE